MDRFRRALLVAGLLVLLVGLVGPLATEARRYVFVEAIQFSLFAFVVPPLLVLGAPLGLARGRLAELAVARAERRRRHPEFFRAAVFLVLEAAAIIAWRIRPSVDALASGGALVWLEALTLVIAGTGLWLELVASPPFRPRLPRPYRIPLAALTMWVTWILAYIVGLSNVTFFHAYHHHPGGLSAGADQEIGVGLLWLFPACCFVPVVFASLIAWLHHDEDPDEELIRVARHERRRRRFGDVGDGSAAP